MILVLGICAFVRALTVMPEDANYQTGRAEYERLKQWNDKGRNACGSLTSTSTAGMGSVAK